jgi:ABC-type polysaccharide/polyol phosphate export permease
MIDIAKLCSYYLFYIFFILPIIFIKQDLKTENSQTLLNLNLFWVIELSWKTMEDFKKDLKGH